MMLRSALQSYQWIGVGGIGGQWANGGGASVLSQRLIAMGSDVLKFGIQLSAPIAIVIFAVNVVFGVLARAVPQLNILVMSVTISAFIGLLVMLLSLGELQGLTINILARMNDWMEGALRAMAGK
jgi:flagellar biosynthesis protein FliR